MPWNRKFLYAVWKGADCGIIRGEMPIYVYEPNDGEKGCAKCRGGFEVMQSLRDERLTRCPECGCAVSRVIQAPGLTHSQTSLPMINETLEAASLAPSDVDLFAAVTGPGSFTGVRIGVCEAKGMAHACGKRIVPVDALEALAVNAFGFPGLVCPILEAGVKTWRVYLPKNKKGWDTFDGSQHYDGGQYIEVPVTLSSIPVFVRR